MQNQVLSLNQAKCNKLLVSKQELKVSKMQNVFLMPLDYLKKQKNEQRDMLELSPALLDKYIASYLLDLKVTKIVF